MRRRQLVELEDLEWFPRAVRDGGTDWLAFMSNATKLFAPVAPLVRGAMDATQTDQVLDLCSGGGGPWLSMIDALSATGPVRVDLSDRFPNVAAFEATRAQSGGRLGYCVHPVDATDVPEGLPGVRTLFNGFHHFPPDKARAILADAVRKRRAIAVFEAISHRGAGLVGIPFQLPMILLLTPWVRPFRWSRLLLTYVVPLIPALVLFDGVMSVFRIYTADELQALVATVPGHETFEWNIGVTPLAGASVGLTHMVGVPIRPAGV